MLVNIFLHHFVFPNKHTEMIKNLSHFPSSRGKKIKQLIVFFIREMKHTIKQVAKLYEIHLILKTNLGKCDGSLQLT